jgi:hypothetical protein
MKKLFAPLLVNFQWYRRRQGGKWYFIQLLFSDGGMQGPIEYWTKELSNLIDYQIIKEETW